MLVAALSHWWRLFSSLNSNRNPSKLQFMHCSFVMHEISAELNSHLLHFTCLVIQLGLDGVGGILFDRICA
jgi:hypothetical protein